MAHTPIFSTKELLKIPLQKFSGCSLPAGTPYILTGVLADCDNWSLDSLSKKLASTPLGVQISESGRFLNNNVDKYHIQVFLSFFFFYYFFLFFV
jgi:hypothetical protein